MCELMGKKDDILVHSLKSLIHDRLGHDDTQLAVIEEYVAIHCTIPKEIGSSPSRKLLQVLCAVWNSWGPLH